MLFSFADMESFPYYSFQSLAEVALLQIEATLSSGHSQLLKTMKELTANSSKDALGPESLINLMTIPREWLKTMTNKLQFQFSPLNFTHIPNIITLFYSHSKHYITP
ncbi:hypothetical protein NC653_027311 [Populus alba x Populus x berolinensis]|uniref:Uncharacterized protein n=1 Tax=Populus alba x Populus x berolinensis TaxID=444605 RepID=A0AAD6M5Y3_9ROSI|nr:hypothetical protein NC653_027311 [Populus alba x Populus x berolinensis]